MADNQKEPLVVVIGAGPAGLYGSKFLANAGVQVTLLNRDIKPGGLAEYGIYYDKYKMKDGLRKQFRQILESPNIEYLGNVTVGRETGLGLEALRDLGYDAILVTVGAQGTKWLGMEGENLKGVYHAKDLVYHYNRLPPFSTQEFAIGKRVALIGAGNVMLDIARWLIRDLKVDEVTAVVRRGPSDVKFTKKEMESVVRNLDIKALDAEIARTRPILEAVGQDALAARDFILSAMSKAYEPVSDTRFFFDFLASPTRMLGNDQDRVCGLEVEENTLVLKDGSTRPRSLGTKRILNVDTVIFCIGDKVDESFGLPVKWNEFIKNPNPAYPVDGLSYEAYDPEAGVPIEGVFVAGWSREASSGLVGVARKDGENGARAVLKYLEQAGKLGPTAAGSAEKDETLDHLREMLERSGQHPIGKEDVMCLEAFEHSEAQRMGLGEYKCKTNEEMLEAMRKKV